MGVGEECRPNPKNVQIGFVLKAQGRQFPSARSTVWVLSEFAFLLINLVALLSISNHVEIF